MEKKKKAINIITNIALIIGVIICVLVIAFKLSFVSIVVSGSSMNPLVYDSDSGYMIKVNNNTKVDRFDVVAVDVEKTDISGRYWIKRILGLPGEKIHIVDNKLFVNDTEIIQTFQIVLATFDREYTFTLDDSQYLIFGDNRIDSVAPIAITHEQIVAKNGFINGKCSSYNYSTGNCSVKSNSAWKWIK